MSSVYLQPNGLVIAKLAMATTAANGGLGTTNVNTTVSAYKPGQDGERIKITLVAGGSTQAVSCVETHPDGDIGDTVLTFTFKNGVSTVTDFEAAVATTPASNFIKTTTNGTGANLLAVTVDEKSRNLIVQGVASATPPTLTSSTAGVALPFVTDRATITTYSSSGNGTMGFVVRMWGYYPAACRWYALGTEHTLDGIVGYLNGGVTLQEISTAADQIAQVELANLRGVSRLAAEVIGISGTTRTVVKAVCYPCEASTR